MSKKYERNVRIYRKTILSLFVCFLRSFVHITLPWRYFFSSTCNNLKSKKETKKERNCRLGVTAHVFYVCLVWQIIIKQRIKASLYFVWNKSTIDNLASIAGRLSLILYYQRLEFWVLVNKYYFLQIIVCFNEKQIWAQTQMPSHCCKTNVYI